jgi:exopolysaccharide biosynthesis WecB/TagA/CpsF family protein
MHALIAMAELEGYGIYILGARSEVLETAVQRLRETHPRLRIAGYRDGYFSEEESPGGGRHDPRLRGEDPVRGDEHPRKEHWLGEYGPGLNVPFVMGVGGAIDIVAGITRRAPRAWQHLGIECLYHVFQGATPDVPPISRDEHPVHASWSCARWPRGRSGVGGSRARRMLGVLCSYRSWKGAVSMRRVVLLLAAVGAVFVGVVGSALGASSVFLCVPSTAGEAVTSGGSTGSCGAGTSVQLPSEAKEQEKLISILPHINYVASGIDKQPTIQFSGVNLQVIDGSGSESTINGTGNLILGYDPSPGTQTGSHNLLLGTNGQSDTSYGGIVGGAYNKISSPYASILGGGGNIASGFASTITGGDSNRTSTSYSTVSGGCSNLAGTGTLTVNSVCTNTVYTGYFSSVLGGAGNQASAENASVSGGAFNLAGGTFASSVSGGKENKATGEGSSISGGGGGEASGAVSSVTGGRLGRAPYFASTVLGGLEEVTEAEFGVKP